jgi:ribosomal protein L17
MLLLRLAAEMAFVEAIRRAITSKKMSGVRRHVEKVVGAAVKTDNHKLSEVAHSLNAILEELVALRVELTDRDAQRQKERAQDIATATRKPWTPWS